MSDGIEKQPKPANPRDALASFRAVDRETYRRLAKIVDGVPRQPTDQLDMDRNKLLAIVMLGPVIFETVPDPKHDKHLLTDYYNAATTALQRDESYIAAAVSLAMDYGTQMGDRLSEFAAPSSAQ